MAQSPRFDSYALVADALRTGLGRAAAAAAGSIDAQRAPRLVVVAFVETWAPPSLTTAVALEAVRMAGDVQAFSQIFIVDASTERDAAWEAGVVSTPALLFYWDGEPVLVRRPAWEDDNKFAGAASVERLVEIIRHARDCCDKCAAESASLVVGLDF